MQAILLDRQGRLWFGTGGGVCWWDGRSFHRPGQESGSPNGAISYLFEDREGRLWVGGYGVLGFYDGAAFHDLVPEYRRRYGEVSSRCGECDGIAQDERGDMWFGFYQVVRYDGSRFYRYGEEEGLSAGRCTVCQAPDGELWIGTVEQLWRCDGQQFQPVPVEFKGPVRKIQQDREGRMWFCTVEYEYAEPTEPLADWGEVALPADLLLRLRRAAELYSVTEVEEYLQEVEQLGEASMKLSTHLRSLRQRHDMEAILAILGNARSA